MHFFTYATEDNFVYEASQSVNYGLDEILEVKKEVDDAGIDVNVSRILIKFDLSHLSQSVVDANASSTAKYYLNMYDAGSVGLAPSQTLYAYPLNADWSMGRGKFLSEPPIKVGSSWGYTDSEALGTYWTGSTLDTGGGWKSVPASSQSFVHTSTELDMRMDVTNIVNSWLDGSNTNYGFIVKRSGSLGNSDLNTDEGSSDALGTFKFFSRDTHTIYSPRLEAVWDSHVWNTGSSDYLNATDLEDISIYSPNLKSKYSVNYDGKLRIVGRPTYPTLTNSPSASNYHKVQYLPSGSLYSIEDAYTEDVIIPYGSGSKLSCDSRGNYIDLNTSGLQAQREYKLKIKIVSGSYVGSSGTDVEVIDNNLTFAVK